MYFFRIGSVWLSFSILRYMDTDGEGAIGTPVLLPNDRLLGVSGGAGNSGYGTIYSLSNDGQSFEVLFDFSTYLWRTLYRGTTLRIALCSKVV